MRRKEFWNFMIKRLELCGSHLSFWGFLQSGRCFGVSAVMRERKDRLQTILLISARPQRQTNAKRCRILGDQDQLKSRRYYAKNGRLIPTAKKRKKPFPESTKVTHTHIFCWGKILVILANSFVDISLWEFIWLSWLGDSVSESTNNF